MERRNFLKLIGGIFGAILAIDITGTLIRFLWPTTTGSVTSGETKVLEKGEKLNVWEAKHFNFMGKAAIIVRTPSGYHAYGAICTHLGCIVSQELTDDDLMICPCHIGLYDPETGDVVAGPPPKPLPVITIEERDDGVYALGWEDPEYLKSLSMYA
jgi:Rieske Fe-S protein